MEEKQHIYQIKIRGCLEERWAAWFGNLSFRYEDNMTILRGHLEDQAALYGVLNHIKNLNLQLISIQIIENKENKK